MENSIWGLAAANLGRRDLIKPLIQLLERLASAIFLQKEILHILHAFRASGPVAVVEVHPLALEDECTNTILY
jgi:hypothetical protein